MIKSPLLDIIGRLDPALDTFQLMVKGLPQRTMRMVHFTGEERVNDTYDFDLELVTPHETDPLSILDSELLGQPASLLMNEKSNIAAIGATTRAVHGIIKSCGVYDRSDAVLRVRVTIGPRLDLLRLRTHNRIYQNKTIPQIAHELLDEWKIPHKFELVGEYAARTYCTQYAETDFDFLRRILSRDGLFFHFRHAPEGKHEELVIMDEPLYKHVTAVSAVAMPIDGKLSTSIGRFKEANLLEIALERGLRPYASRLSSFDFRNPRLPLRDVKLADTPPGVLGDLGAERFGRYVHGHEAEHEVNESAKKREIDAARALEGERADAVRIRGVCRFRQFTPGHSFALEDHAVDMLNRDWVLTSIRHEGWVPEFDPEAKEVYRNEFTATTAETPLRMPVEQRRRAAHPTQTATVVGAAEGELLTDSLGRIKVQFHWDLEGKSDDKSSCWIRVSQPWAGPGFGWQFLPRVGAEVVVSFLDGDPDRPLVVGAVYNGTNPTPFGLPQSSTRSGIKTQSVPGGGGSNELFFEDRAGGEQISLSAHRNFDTVVGKDHSLAVTGDSSTRVSGQVTEHIGGTHTTTVVGGQTNIVTLHKTNQVLGDAIDAIKGNADRRVSGDDNLRVQGTLRHEITDSEVSIAKDSVLRVKGHLATIVGAENARKSSSLHVQGDNAMYSTGVTEVISESAIVFRCGLSSIRLGPASVEITSPLINVAGAAVDIGAGTASIVAEKKMKLNAEALNLTAKSSSLHLEVDADLGGEHVNIKKHTEETTVGMAHRSLTTVRLVDEDGTPAANRRFVIVGPDGERSGVLNDKGEARLELDGTQQIFFPDVDKPKKS